MPLYDLMKTTRRISHTQWSIKALANARRRPRPKAVLSEPLDAASSECGLKWQLLLTST